MVWFVFFATICSVVFFFTRDSYLGELASSFLPYLVVGRLLLAIIALVVVLASKKRWAKFLSGCSFVIFVLMVGWGGEKIYDFYDGAAQNTKVSEVSGFSVLYDNVYIHNRQYGALQKTIEKHDPDVLILVEFARHHWSALESFFGTMGFAYTNRINRETLYDSNLFASHFPIGQVITYGGLDDYINIESQDMMLNGRTVMFHVVHAISPISPDHFAARNKQLTVLANLMKQATTDYPDHLHVLIGDFNTSPRSVYYEQFQQDLGAQRINHTRQIPLLMTWKIPGISRIQSHIDHVWIRGDADVSLEPYWLDGSDHRMFKIIVR